ncbi:MAG: CoA-binding protein [Planctomycetaceae bacterium]|nr:CoA-binding protein [Planctomycetaceae bacterium]
MTPDKQIADFLNARTFAVVGASTDRSKYGNKVLRAYLQNSYAVTPVNPGTATVEGLTCYSSVKLITPVPEAISVITPPAITENVVAEAISIGIRNIWMQPGAESDQAIAACEAAGVNVIHSGPCLLVVIGFRER